MTKRNNNLWLNKRTNRCIYSGEPIMNRPAVLEKYCVEYTKKQGYKIIKSDSVDFGINLLRILLFIFMILNTINLISPLVLSMEEISYLNTSDSEIIHYPSILYNSGYVYSNITLKNYKGSVDVIFNADSNKVVPTDFYLYENEKSNYNKSNRFIYVGDGIYVIKNLNLSKSNSNKFKFYIKVNGKVFSKYNISFIPSDNDFKLYKIKYPSFILDPWINSSGDGWDYEFLDEGLTYYYSFDSSGTNAIEKINRIKNITLGGVSTQRIGGIIGNVSHHDGDSSNTALKLLTNSTDTSNGVFSISFWLNDTMNNNEYHTIHDFRNSRQFIMYSKDAYLKYYPDGATLKTCNILIPKDIFTHIVLVFNGTDLLCYQNGSLKSYNTHTIASTTETANYHLAEGYDGTQDFHGDIDEFGIWNRTLNSSDITFLYYSGFAIQWNQSIPCITDLVTVNNGDLINKSSCYLGRYLGNWSETTYDLNLCVANLTNYYEENLECPNKTIFELDLSSNVTAIYLLILVIVVIGCLYVGWWSFGGFITIIAGFMLGASGFGILASILIICIGVVIIVGGRK